MSTHTFSVFIGTPSGVSTHTTTRTLGHDEVYVRITHSGICCTDCDHRRSPNNLGLGHEGVGVVENLGSACKALTVGDRVGWGFMNDTCGHCRECLQGEDVWCQKREMYLSHNNDQGSLGTHAVWKERFVFKIPPELSGIDAAPLMCAGCTVFTALFHPQHLVSPLHTVGIVGIGGLGHLAIQFAAKMGCRVVVFSRTESKREEAMMLGAHAFYAMKDQDNWGDMNEMDKIDHLLVTTSSPPNWVLFLGVMNNHSRITPLGLYMEELNIPSYRLMTVGITLVGSAIANRYMTTEMLKFAARNGVRPVTEVYPMNKEGIEEVFDRLEGGKVRYKAVLVAP